MACTNDKLLKQSDVKTNETTSPRASRELQFLNDKGLGQRFWEKLNLVREKIHQVNAVTSGTETNGTLKNRAILVACEMRSRGVRAKDIIVICSASHEDQTVALLASLFLGAIVAPIDVGIAIADLKANLTSLKPKIIFCDVRMIGILEIIYRTTPQLVLCPMVIFGNYTDRLAFEKLLGGNLDPNFRPVRIDDTRHTVAFIVPSQATDSSRLICISHRAILYQISIFAGSFVKDVERVLSYFPLSWITQILIVCYCLDKGVVRVLPDEFSERGACRLINDLKIDCAFLGTNYANQISKHACLEDFDMSSLKLIFVGGFVTTACEMAKFRSAFKKSKVIQCYGTTEMSGLVATFECDDYASGLKRPGSIGKLLPYIKSKILDIDTRQELGANHWGELILCAPTSMLGYFKDNKGTQDAYDKNHFKTGDVALIDTEGYLYIQGRISERLTLNGQYFFPKEIEEMISIHPEVEDVVVCNADGQIVACVLRKMPIRVNADELLDFIKANLPENRRPSQVRFLEFVPKTTTGKIKRNSLKEAVGLEVTIVYSKSVVSFET